MKKTITILIVLALAICMPPAVQAQIDNPFKKLKKKTEQKVNKKMDEEMDNALDGNKNKEKEEQQPNQEQIQAEQPAEDAPAGENKTGEKDATSKLTWAKYDFIPGDEVFFEDNLLGEENGEFPSRWDIHAGNVENAVLGNDNVIMFRDDSYIMPYLENADQDYLPDLFTLEFDCYFHEGDAYQSYVVLFYDKTNQRRVDLSDMQITWNRIGLGSFEGWYPGAGTSARTPKEIWRHVSISFNTRSMKAYLDDTRLVNIPNLKVNPTGITIWGDYNPYNEHCSYIKNIRLARGGVKLYDRMLQDGKIITNGIRFDVNKATLRPESMGIINEIADLMKDHPEVNFSIEGHTDSDGDTEANLKLSEARAQAVKDMLVSMGIESDRLTTKGYGESNPIAANTTAEGKANNRRVEFVKL